MADRPKNPEPFADTTEVSVGRRQDTAVDEPIGLSDAPSTDLGAPPSAAETEDRSVVATQPDQPPASAAPTESQKRPAPLPAEFDANDAPPSAFAEATVQLPTFGRGGEQAPPSRFADATVPLQVQRKERSTVPSNARGARRLPTDVQKSRAKRTAGEEESAQNVRRIQSSRPTLSAEPETDSREPAIDYAQLPSFDEDDDIYGQPTEALTFRDDEPSLAPSRASTFDTPSPVAPNALATDETDAPAQGDGVPSSWIPSDLNAQNLAEEQSARQSQDGFPSSWIPDTSPPDSRRRIPSEILAEAGQTMTRAEQAEKNREGPSVPVPLPLADNSRTRPVDAAAVDPLSAAPSAKQGTGTWNPGASDSAFVPKAVPPAAVPAEVPLAAVPQAGVSPAVPPAAVPAAVPPAAVDAAPSDVTNKGASVPAPKAPGNQPRKKGGCAVVAGAGCLFFVLAAAATGGIWFWYQQHDGPARAKAVVTIAGKSKTPAAAAPKSGTSGPSAQAAPSSTQETDKPAAKTDKAKAPEETPALDPSAHEDPDDDRARPRIRRRGTGTFFFRPTGGKRAQRLAFYAAVRGALKSNGLALAPAPVRRGFDVAGKVRGSRIDDDGEALKVETDCRLTVREQPSGKRIRAISGTGVAKGTPGDRKKLVKQAISACGRDLTKDIIPLLSGG